MKEYETPVLEQDTIELEDIIASSGLVSYDGDNHHGWGGEGDFF